MRFLILTVALVACQSSNKEQKSYSDRLDEMKSKRDLGILMKPLLLTLLLTLTSCSWFDRSNEPKSDKDENLGLAKDRRALYCELSKPIYDAQGFVGSKCDGLTFT